MKRIRDGFSMMVVGAVALCSLTGCGFTSDGGGPTIDVRGNVEAILPVNAGRDIVVFVYTLRNPQEDCENPQLPPTNTQAQVRTLEPGESEFEVRNAKAGPLVVAFLLDEPGNDADGRIDEGDPVAVLEDPDCVLDDVPNKYIVQADDVRINFTLDEEDGFPAPGRAEADDLSEGPE